VVLTLRWLRHLDPAWVVLFNHALTAVALSPLLFTTGCWPHGHQWWLLAAFGMVQMGLPYLLFAYGMKTVSSNEASTLLLLEPLLVPFWVWVAFRHTAGYTTPSLTTLVGGGLILLGLVLRYTRRAPDEGPAKAGM
jgi:drug/metabolite transporter, DME family